MKDYPHEIFAKHRAAQKTACAAAAEAYYHASVAAEAPPDNEYEAACEAEN